MKHPIGYDEWLGYLDGALDDEAARRVRGHIDACGDCQATWNDLLAATASLRDAAREYVAEYTVDGGALRRGRERVLARIRSPRCSVALESVAAGQLTVGRLRRLQHVVAPVCGAQTAFRLIVASVGRTPAPGDPAAWDRFLNQLAGLTSAMCGRSTARLVLRIGDSLA